MSEELQYAISKEAEWKKAMEKTDRGSYCEEPGYDFKIKRPVLLAYQNLVNALLEFQRSGIEK